MKELITRLWSRYGVRGKSHCFMRLRVEQNRPSQLASLKTEVQAKGTTPREDWKLPAGAQPALSERRRRERIRRYHHDGAGRLDGHQRQAGSDIRQGFGLRLGRALPFDRRGPRQDAARARARERDVDPMAD